jgi:molybdenum cofactor cytidylyltransferase
VRPAAVVLAAGSGSRLGGVAKALLASGDGTTFIQRIRRTLDEIGCDQLVVVVGPPHGDRIVAELSGCRTVWNDEPSLGMATSIALGFATLLREAAAPAAWLWPVDHPTVTAATLATLCAAWRPGALVRPRYAGRGGHPPLVARELWARLAACGALDGGARAALAEAPAIDVPVDDAAVVRDVDTPADLREPS